MSTNVETVDIIVVGACFAGLSFGHHISSRYKTVIIDRKTKLNTAIESTGLITQATRDLLADFCQVDAYIPNRITTIGVVSPDYNKYFFSHTDNPWIYSTDTPELVKHLSETLPSHVELRLGAGLLSYEIERDSGDSPLSHYSPVILSGANTPEESLSHMNREGSFGRNPQDDKLIRQTVAGYPIVVTYLQGGEKKQIRAKFLVGADGSHSLVAKSNPALSRNTRFLAGHEKVFYGDITFGEHPENTIYHFWFGEFSLGYGGWLSPTIINGKKAFRLGLAKLEADAKDLKKIDEFIKILLEKKIIRIEGDPSKAIFAFGHLIPMGGALKNVYDRHTLLIGDAAGFCGAFAADGIKGAVVSGKVGAELVSEYLAGEKHALGKYHATIQSHNGLMTYYKKQVLYRFLWDRMKSNRSFHILYDLIAAEKDSFLYQFCDSKDKHKSLMWVVLKIKNVPRLMWYTLSLIADLLR